MNRKEMGRMGLPGDRWPVLLAPLAAAVAAAAVMAGPPAASGAAHTRGMTSRASLAHQAIAYVTAAGKHTGDDTVTPIQTATNTALPPIKTGRKPLAIAITPNGTTIYVVNELSGTVTPVQTATNKPLPPIKVGAFPLAIAITP